MAEIEEELKSHLMKAKEMSEKAVLKLNIRKTKIMASGPITSRQIEGGKVEIDVFLESLAFSMIQWILAIWSLVPLPFLKPA